MPLLAPVMIRTGSSGIAGFLASGYARRHLRRQPLDPPAAAIRREVAKAVVEPVGAVLPELPRPRRQPVAAPAVAHRQRPAAMLAVELVHPSLEPLAAGHRPALR